MLRGFKTTPIIIGLLGSETHSADRQTQFGYSCIVCNFIIILLLRTTTKNRRQEEGITIRAGCGLDVACILPILLLKWNIKGLSYLHGDSYLVNADSFNIAIKTLLLCENWPSMEFFLVRIFL